MAGNRVFLEKLKKVSLRFFVVAGIFMLALLLFAAIADEMVLENENHLDQVAFHELAGWVSPSTTNLMLAITFFGSSYFLAPAYILVIIFFLVWKKNRRLSLDVAAIGIASTIILFSLKAIFHRHRPPHPLVHTVNGFSFPSGHAFSSFTFFGLLIYIIWDYRVHPVLRWALTVVFFLLACAIGLSRVYLHVHYASDVVAGFCLCIVWLTLSFWLLHLFRKKAL